MITEDSTSVATHALACLRLLGELVLLIQDPQCKLQDQIQFSDAQDALGRYKVWGGNLGAFISGHKSRRSLQYRLREASQIKDQIIKLLVRLDTSLERGKSPPCVEAFVAAREAFFEFLITIVLYSC